MPSADSELEGEQGGWESGGGGDLLPAEEARACLIFFAQLEQVRVGNLAVRFLSAGDLGPGWLHLSSRRGWLMGWRQVIVSLGGTERPQG